MNSSVRKQFCSLKKQSKIQKNVSQVWTRRIFEKLVSLKVITPTREPFVQHFFFVIFLLKAKGTPHFLWKTLICVGVLLFFVENRQVIGWHCSCGKKGLKGSERVCHQCNQPRNHQKRCFCHTVLEIFFSLSTEDQTMFLEKKSRSTTKTLTLSWTQCIPSSSLAITKKSNWVFCH